MSYRFQSAGFADYAAVVSAPAVLRIAIPSWRLRFRSVATEPAPLGLSREEIQKIFDRDLNPWKRRRSLTQREEQQKDMASRLRAALYPQGALFSH